MSLYPKSDQKDVFYTDAKTLLENSKDMKLRDISYDIVDIFNKKMNDFYTTYFKEKYHTTSEEISKTWIEKAKKCTRTKNSGRYWPFNSRDNISDEYYGYNVDIRDEYGITNLLLGPYDENSLVLESEINKIIPNDLEKFALAVAGYKVKISNTKERYYSYDY